MPGKDTLQLHTEWVDDQAYMTVPSAWSALAGDAPTVSIPTSPTMVRGIDTALTQSAVAVTYAKILLDELTAHATVHRLPGRTIGGVRVTGTRVDLTLTQLLKVVPELAPPAPDARGRAVRSRGWPSAGRRPPSRSLR